MKNKLLQSLKGRLIVSCQALEGEPLYHEEFSLMPFMARAAKIGGACCIRANGVRDVVAIKKEIGLPIIGLIKKQYEPFEPYITATMTEVDALVEAGADIVAFDATLRPRADQLTVNEFIACIKCKYPDLLLMADISNEEEGLSAYRGGVDLISTTLSGYTPYTQKTAEPDYELVRVLADRVPIPVIAEGRIHSPEQAKKMLDLGAYAIVVGGAITRPLEITTRFVSALGE